jgi:solute:Na+ symporter, SSS family
LADWVVVSAVTGLYLVVVLGVGLRAGTGARGGGLEGYVADGRHMGFLLLFFIMGAEVFSAFAFLGAPGWAYSMGAPALYILGAFALALVPWWWIGPRTARLGVRYGYLTQAELLGHRFRSPLLAALVSLIGVVVLFPYLTIQIVGAGFLVEASTGGHVPFWLGALMAFLVTAVYVFASGLRGIGWTNVMQGVLMVVVAWALGLAIPHRFYGGVGPMFDRLVAEAPDYLLLPGHDGAMGWGAFSGNVAVTVLGLSMWPHLFSKAYGAKSESAIHRTILLYPLYGLLMVPIILVGFAGVLLIPELEQPDRILLELVARAGFHPVLVGVLLSGALAAAMSTGGNIAHTAASMLTRDVYARMRPGASDEAQLRLTRFLVLALCAGAYAMALDTPASIIALVLAAFAGLIQFLPLVLAAFFWRRATPAGALAGLTGGVTVGALFTWLWSPPLGVHAGIWGIVVNVALLGGVSLLTPPMDEGWVSGFVDQARIPIARQTPVRAKS